MHAPPTRRVVIAAASAAGACRAPAGARPGTSPISLKSVAPFTVGSALSTAGLADPALVRLLLANVTQVTPEWEMKMEAVLRADGGLDFGRADALAAFARVHRLRLHAHALVWHEQTPPAFLRLDGAGAAFAAAYRAYILAVVGRYAGQASGWDVVNEAVAQDGGGPRASLWRRNLGEGYAALAFQAAREADAGAVLFLNDYDLESSPKKRGAFLRLAESLLRQGAPLGGLGSQTHLGLDLPRGAMKAALTDLSRLGLPVHVSELDVSTRRGAPPLATPGERLRRQARLVGEAAEAFATLPRGQRYAFTLWGLRDGDSWLTRRDAGERPALFDDEGRLKPAAAAFARATRPR